MSKVEESVNETVMKYMKTQNRPYSLQNVFDNLRGELPKAKIGLALDAYGAQKIYCVKQGSNECSTDSSTDALKSEIRESAAALMHVKSQLDVLNSDLLQYDHFVSACTKKLRLKAKCDELNQQVHSIETCRSDKESPAVLPTSGYTGEELASQQLACSKEFHRRKRIGTEIIALISEQCGMSRSEIIDELGLEIDPPSPSRGSCFLVQIFFYLLSMKRAVLALFSSPNEPKRVKSLSKTFDSSRIVAHLDSVERVQSQLLDLDIACSKEQLAVQRRFDLIREPLLEQRRQDISQIPQFWFLAIANHPSTDRAVFDAIDAGPLSSLLEVELQDNLDDQGSYRIALTFSPNTYFSESILERTVTFSSSSTTVCSTPIRWAPNRRPRVDPRSFFTWFSSQDEFEEIDYGEIFRQDLFQNPFAYYCKLSVSKSNKSSPEDVEVRDATRDHSDEEN